MLVREAKTLGNELRRERNRQHLTQKQLAERAGLRQATISAVEGGKPRTELRVVFDIMAALGLQLTLSSRSSGDSPRIEDIF